MHPEPDDPATATRMRAAHHRACAAFGARPHDGREVWGWNGRTLSRPVSLADRPAWLRLASSPADAVARTFWDGSRDARALPATIPRPRLRRIHDWHDRRYEYRAELYDHVPTPTVSRSAALTDDPGSGLPTPWWTALRTSLDALSAIPTRRHSITQQYLDIAMPRFLGPLDPTVRTWTTAHGDCHWANLCGPQLQLLDWEGWGRAPAGYDAATLHAHSLTVPAVAARVYATFRHVLDTPDGHFAQLVAITELLHGTTRGDNLTLKPALHARAARLRGGSNAW
jgi:hypothetical protein